MSKHKFKAEVSELLKLVVHSLYSHQEIFLRELISNASDALDKLKYLTLSHEQFKSLEFSPRIEVKLSEDGKILEIIDNGIGMNSEELSSNLGTIASSGTRSFLAQLQNEQSKNSSLIGQFGVGFYSAFMVADLVEVHSRRANEEQGWLWSSDGQGEFQVVELARDGWGSTVRLHLNESGREYASRWQLESLVKKFSNHIAFPIHLHTYSSEGKDGAQKELTSEQVNSAAALWKKNRREISEQEYLEFYHSLQHNEQKPLLTVHVQAEGQLEYAALLYVPEKASFDLFQPDYHCGCRLYVRRVLVSDDNKELLPTYLRFLVGVIDSEDLPLNVSREILQKNRILVSIREALTKRVLSELQTLATNEVERYHAFIEQYNRLLKEGIYSDYSNREALQNLLRFKSSKVEGWTSLADYKERMKEGQKAIYTLSGGDEARLRRSPLLGAYNKQGIEVLLLTDEIDDFVIPAMGNYQQLELKSINRNQSDDELDESESQDPQNDCHELVQQLKQALEGRVKDVTISKRLTDSPACVVNDSHDPTLQMQQIMQVLGKSEGIKVLPILEINPQHRVIQALRGKTGSELFATHALLLLEQALLVAGAPLPDPVDTAERIIQLLQQSVA